MPLTSPLTLPDADRALPSWRSVLAVVAHPDDESFGLGAVISAFIESGAGVSVLCFTHGEASTLHGVEGDLSAIRERELDDAARTLGMSSVRLLDYSDGALADVDLGRLSAHVVSMAQDVAADGILVFDSNGITGHPDHVHATAAAVLAAHQLEIDVLAWSLPQGVATTLAGEFDAGFQGRAPEELGIELRVDRARQREAVTCHPSQAVPGSALWRRLALLGDHEYLRWLVGPHTAASVTSKDEGH
jgi:N-acetylglucosamine malate deacetylase 2